MPDTGTSGGGTSPPLRGDVPPAPVAAFVPADDVPVLIRKGQVYRFEGVGRHVTKDGRVIATMKWETDCAECRRPFKLFSIGKFEPSRRCQSCKAPGRRVARDS